MTFERTHLEIGSRHGGFLEALARRHPADECLGIEYRFAWVNGARERAARRGLRNVRYLCTDARIAVRRLFRNEELSSVHIFFPDPWPKKRHRSRRLLQAPFLEELAVIMEPGAPLYVLTDVEDYAVFAAQEVSRVADLEPLPESL